MDDAREMLETLREHRELWPDKEASHTWMMTPNVDIGGLSPAEAAYRRLYGAVTKAVRAEAARRNRPTYKTLESTP